MSPRARCLRSLLAILFLALFLLGRPGTSRAEEAGAGFLSAARAWLDTLDAGRKHRAMLPVDAPDRTSWHYVPRRRRGLSLREMTQPQQRAAKVLVSRALGSAGSRKAEAIFQVEAVLQAGLSAAARGRDPSWRDPMLYHLALFGEPGPRARWGFRVEGHHLSVNLTLRGDRIVSATPLFLGASPAEVRRGPRTGLRPLSREEDLARRLITSLPPAATRRALVSARAPGDVFFGPGRVARSTGRGVPVSDLPAPRRAELWALIEEYVRNAPSEYAEETLRRYRRTPATEIRFLWMGGRRAGEAHAYRIESPAFLIEYVNRGDHIHSVWRDPARDFGGR